MRAEAKAPANIAFIKFWGKKDAKLRIPMNSSISMNLSEAYTVTSVEFLHNLKQDLVTLDGKKVDGEEKMKVVSHLDRVRAMAHISTKAVVESKNNFPKGSGLASSASGFAALSMAAAKAAGLKLTERELSIIARIGSGSACRSIPDGIVEWKTANSSEKSYAYSLYSTDYWDICDVIAIVNADVKKVSSTEGHSLVESSPFYKARIKSMPLKIKRLKLALKNRNFNEFGEILESEAINMHAVMMTSSPALIYWSPQTIDIINKIYDLRSSGLKCYFTIDAGPNVHVMCLKKDAPKLKAILEGIDGILEVILNNPTRGAHLLSG